MTRISCLSRHRHLSLWLTAGMALTLSAAAGCTRRFYRERTDRDVEQVLTEKNCFEPWKIDQFHVYPDPNARFADPSNPDRPPMPPDDPAASALAPNPQRPGKAGIAYFEGCGYLELLKMWDASNRAAAAADPEPRRSTSASNLPEAPPSGDTEEQALKTNEQPYLITIDQAAEMGLINSREFQNAREDLYTSALAVTLERFAFAAQFFATEELIREATGRETAQGQGNRWRANTGAGVSKLFATGALLTFRFANQVVLEMSGNGQRLITPSSVTLDLVQPLLRGGGRAVTLEPLTQVERSLVYAIRSYARFRKQFYVSIAGGGSLNPSFPGGGFGDPRLPQAGQAPIVGFLPTLRVAAVLENDRSNVRELERILAFYRQLQGGGEVSPLQTDQVLQQLLSGRSQVLNDEQQLRDNLDRFKLQLGLPTNTPLALDDGPVRPLNVHLQRLREVFAEDAAVQAEERRLIRLEAPTVRAEMRRLMTELPIVRGTRFAGEILNRWDEWQTLTNEALNARIKDLEAQQEALAARRNELELKRQPVSEDLLQQINALDFPIDLGGLERALRFYETQPWRDAFAGLGEAERQLRREGFKAELFRGVFRPFVQVVGVARDERVAQLRERWPKLAPVCLEGVDLLGVGLDEAYAAAARYALANRLDLMNARAQLVDAWRLIAVDANALLGAFNVGYHVDSATPANTTNPFALGGSRTRHQLILDGELPLVRRLERNAYRTTLIAYQRQRRSLQAAEDQVLLEVRTQLRQLRVLSENYKIQQRAIQVAYSQRDNSLETLRAPAAPGQGSNAASAAALTQQLLQAQGRVPQNENQLYTIYLNYLVARLQLFSFLELMPLDPRGVWSDEHASHCAGPCPDPSGGPDHAAERPERLPTPRPEGAAAPPQ